jgi:ABC-type uncharacterized transport system substrate-binding protein
MTTQHPGIGTLDTQADALYVAVDALVGANRTRIITLALGARLPTIFNQREFVQAGGLMSYGPNFSALFRRAADLVVCAGRSLVIYRSNSRPRSTANAHSVSR